MTTTQVVYVEDERYPALLKEIADAPRQLYYKETWPAHHVSQGDAGDVENIFDNCLAVVGSRRMTSYGKRATEQIVGEVAAAGIPIVSGFMYGVDAASHRAAVETGGRTIAVMPCGIERIHPEYQKDLYEKIMETGGLIISEWQGDSMPQLWSYPKRNRIVAGLSKATLVVEAGLESGSLITAELAKKFGRKLFAIPGPITSEVSKGTAKLIQEGATLVHSAKDILEFFDLKNSDFLSPQPIFRQREDSAEQRILETLQRESLEVDLLARALHMPAAELGTILSILELQGLINQEGGKYYIS